LRKSTVKPDFIHIINNGANWTELAKALGSAWPKEEFEIATKLPALGVAASWNWFIEHVPEERIITNDDMVFAPQSIASMVQTHGDIVMGCGFSCFLIRDSCVKQIGLFDEEISPGYAYYEDEDYHQRIREAYDTAREVTMADAPNNGLIHGDGVDGSSTYRAGTPEEISDHWRRHHIAHMNFLAKWGAEPSELRKRWEHKHWVVRGSISIG
jgi:hypothetical protein